MAGGVLGTATSGLLAFQRSLSTTGHNIANASTPGYSRQRVEVGTQTPQSSGAGYIGTGVKGTTVTRMYDQFLVDRVRTSTASVNSLDIYSQYASRVADLLGDADAGLNGSLETFFNSMQTLANDPTSIPARQLVLSEGQGLVARFQYLDDQLRNTRKEVNGQLGTMVQEVNTLSQGIADINKEIVVAIGRSGGQPPNDLLDTRDRLLDELSALVSVSRVQQDDGAMNVFIGNGQSLVTGYNAATLSVQGDGFDATEMNIMYTVGSVSSDITANISGGKLGGLLSLRDEVLDAAQNALGRIAVVLGTELNAQHGQGMDLDGNLGGDLFSLGTPQVSGNTLNTGTGTVTASFDNATINALTIEGLHHQLRRRGLESDRCGRQCRDHGGCRHGCLAVQCRWVEYRCWWSTGRGRPLHDSPNARGGRRYRRGDQQCARHRGGRAGTAHRGDQCQRTADQRRHGPACV